ncbi:MAG: PadR family transcriptional regulator [Candidatus Thermoplasmatota archaeon]|nr:PadR family transcriptional regulator [Candidatus Thermoplasmatota archaeon]
MRGSNWGFGQWGDFAPDRIFRKRGGLKYYVLWLLHERPMKGSDMMSEIERQTHGWWKPSPGTIYPLLSTLTEDGMISRNEDSVYTITEKGLVEIGMKAKSAQSPGDSIGKVIVELDGIISYLEDTAPHDEDEKARISKLAERLRKLSQ